MCASVPCNGPKPMFTRVPRPMSLENEVESSDDGFQSQISAALGIRAENRKQPIIAPQCSSEDKLKAQIKQAQINAIVQRMEQSPAQCTSDDELKAQINAIVDARAGHHKQSVQPVAPSQSPGACLPESKLQAQINAIVRSHGEHGKPCEQSPSCSDDQLKAQINAIVEGRAEHRKQSEEHA